jgi:hypothetical protein
MKHPSVLLVVLVLSSLPLAAELPQTVSSVPATPAMEQPPTAPTPERPLFGTPEPLNTSYCHAVAMTSCDSGHWLACEGTALCDYRWKWVYCDGQTWVCP